MVGQTFILKKVARMIIKEIAMALGASREQARKIAKRLALSGAILAAVASLDFIGLKASIIEEMADEGIDAVDADVSESTFSSDTRGMISEHKIGQISFSGILDEIHDEELYSNSGNDLAAAAAADNVADLIRTGNTSPLSAADILRLGGWPGGGGGGFGGGGGLGGLF